ncbi:MAG: hypothetical protein GEU78_19990 [Actinobacteria bacterium]|nr:hypothetical protein [Actinomycetota bacterium]
MCRHHLDNCPSVSVDEATGDFLFVGKTEHDAQTLQEISSHCKIGSDENTVRVPARMAHIVAEAVRGSTPVS